MKNWGRAARIMWPLFMGGSYNVYYATNYNNGTRSGPEKPSQNPKLRSESAGAGNGQERTPPIWQAL
ncbi:hypothetical protein J6590_066794 [Homalodisca vitripennis]|nr:hypothetical protein J6590_066794 [Homalodisca vitripennis]